MTNLNKVLVIVPCAKKKIWSKNSSVKSIAAKDAYISNYFKLCKLYSERFSDKWLILSGKYGIIEPDFILHGDYNMKLISSNEFKNMVNEQLRNIISEGFTKIISLCGKRYTQFLENVFSSCDLKIYAPLEGLTIGVRQEKIKRCLKENHSL